MVTEILCLRKHGTNVPDASDSARYKALGNSVAVPCVMFLMQGIRYAVDHPEKRQ